MRQNNLIVLVIFSTLLLSTTSMIVCQGEQKIKYSTGYADSDHLSCTCENSYVWRPSVHKCVKDCSSVDNSVSNCMMDPGTPIDQCQCLPGFYWMSPDCVKDCSKDQNSYKVYNLSYTDQCNCLLEKNYIWDQTLKKCIKNCTADSIKGNNLNSLDLSDTTYSTCLCNSENLVYQSPSNTCLQKCNPDSPLSSNQNCAQCYGNKQCTVGCPKYGTIGYLIDLDQNNKCKCDTQKGYKLQTQPGPYQYQCVLDCTKAINSLGTLFNRTSCDCTDINYQFITTQNNYGCSYLTCPDDITNPNIPVCKRDCNYDTVHLTGKLKQGSNTDCQCKLPNQIWIPPTPNIPYNGNCAIDCTNPNLKYIKNIRDSQDSCLCIDTILYQFYNTQIGCTRRCGTQLGDLLHSTDFNKNDQSICNCINGYHYQINNIQYIGKCIINCITNIYTLDVHISQIQCACKYPLLYKYNITANTCTRYCPGLQDSTGMLNITVSTLDVCQCNNGFIYDSANGVYPNLCYRDCSSNAIEYSIGNFDRDSCKCDNQHFFEERTKLQYPLINNKNLYKCVRNCDNIANSYTQYNPDAINQCLCLPGYIWNSVTKTCDDPCGKNSIIPNSVSTACYDPLECICATNYKWDKNTLKCIQCNINSQTSTQIWDNINNICRINCIKYNAKQIYTNIIYDSCICQNGIWNNNNLQCGCGLTGATWNGDACTCLNGALWDNIKKQCICANGAIWDSVNQKCTCGVTATWNRISKICQCINTNSFWVQSSHKCLTRRLLSQEKNLRNL